MSWRCIDGRACGDFISDVWVRCIAFGELCCRFFGVLPLSRRFFRLNVIDAFPPCLFSAESATYGIDKVFQDIDHHVFLERGLSWSLQIEMHQSWRILFVHQNWRCVTRTVHSPYLSIIDHMMLMLKKPLEAQNGYPHSESLWIGAQKSDAIRFRIPHAGTFLCHFPLSSLPSCLFSEIQDPRLWAVVLPVLGSCS